MTKDRWNRANLAAAFSRRIANVLREATPGFTLQEEEPWEATWRPVPRVIDESAHDENSEQDMIGSPGARVFSDGDFDVRDLTPAS
jgi:hypothetical protein